MRLDDRGGRQSAHPFQRHRPPRSTTIPRPIAVGAVRKDAV